MTGFTDPFGGGTVQAAEVSYASVSLSANLATVWPPYATGSNQYLARLMDVSATVGGLSINLPSALQATQGQDVFFANTGANSFTVNDYAGNVIAVIAPGTQRYIYLTDNTTAAGVWRTILMGVGSSSPDASQLAGFGIKAIGATLNAASPTSTFSINTTFTTSDRGKTYVNSGGAVTATLPLTNTATNDYFIEFRNQGTGALTLAPSGGELIDGSATVILQVNESCIVHAGTGAWYTVGRGRNQQFNFTQLSKAVTGGTTTLSLTEASNVVQTYTGVLLSNEVLVLPAVVQVYYIINSTTSGGYTFKIQSPTPGSILELPSGQNAVVFCDGTNVINASTSVSGLSSLLLAAGSAAGPSLAIANANNGFYAPTGTSLAASANGSNVITWAAGQSLALQGSAGTPSYSFAGYTGTGVYSSAADELAFSTDGTQRMKISAAGVITLSSPLTVPAGGTGVATLTGIVKGNGAAAFSAATSGTDYAPGTSALTTGIVKSTTTTGALSIAAAGTDYVAPGVATGSGLTMSTARMLGRTTAGTGAIEEISIGANLTLAAGVLSASGAGSPALSAITAAAGANTIANADNAQAWNWALTTAAKSAFAVGETSAATGGSGAQYILSVSTLAASTANPFNVATRGVDTIVVSRTGDVTVTALNGTTGSGTTGSAVSVTGGAAAASASAAGGAITLTGGVGSTTTTGGVGGAVSLTGGLGGLAAAGGAASVVGGRGGATGAGGALTLTSGAGGSTSGASGNVTLSSGTTTSGASGNIAISVPVAGGNAATGNIAISTAITGSAGTNGITITVGNGNAVTAGILTLQGGTSGAAQSGNSGGIVITAGAAGAVASVAGGPVVITAGAGSTTTTGGVGGAVSLTGGIGGLALAGGAASVVGGRGGATGAGGALTLTSGAGGATSGNSGNVTLSSGTTTSGNSGTVAISTAAGTGAGSAGSMTIATGNGSGASHITVTVGNATGGAAAGILTLQGGTSSTAQSGNSGGVVLLAGAAGAVASVAGGPIVLTAGAGSTTTTGGVGGAVLITSGAGGLAAAGGSLNITGGQGGATGNGGPINIQGGAGGATSGNGGALGLNGGNATTSGNGGGVVISAGTRAGTGAGASVSISAGVGITSGAGGNVNLTAGTGAAAVGGDITLTCGTGSSNGAVNFVNTSVANGSVATTVTSLGPTGSSTTIVGWLKIKVGGTTQYIPYW